MWVDRFKLGLVLVVVGLVLIVANSNGAAGIGVGWLVCVYVLVRAVPGIRNDWRRARSRLAPQREWRL